jgi:LysM repeat protein
LWDFTANDDPEQVTGWAIQVAVDSGPQKFATGTPTLNASGVPVSYKVRPGDVYEFISRRFCINLAYLYTINSVRRADATLYAGDIINLDSHTILTVGTENGRTYNTMPHPDPIPPQH